MISRLLLRLVSLAIVAASVVVVGSAAPSGAIVDRDCSDFSSQREAQNFYIANGGPSSDPHRLDADDDGKACDSLPCPCGASAPAPIAQPVGVVRQWVRIVRVVDGDTAWVRLGGGATKKVRFLGIDTPERDRCGYAPATRSLRRLLPVGVRVLLISDPSQARVDRYGRLLRYVEKGGRDINRIQVSRGWAKVYVYGGRAFRRVAAYRTAQRAAKAAPRGIWRSC